MFSMDRQIGNYRILSSLSPSRGPCQLYLARRPDGQEQFDLAIWERINIISQTQRNQFFEEARAIASLQYPGIVPLLDYGFEEDMPYVVREHSEQPLGTLRDLLKKGRVSQQEAFSIIEQVGEALRLAHQDGVSHGRLAPEYVRFSSSGKALLEFPITMLPNPVQVGHAEAYEAPEQDLLTKSLLSDQYSLACIAYELLTGQPPLGQGISQTELNALPAWLRPVIKRALEQKPVDRFFSIEQFLQAFRSSRPVRQATLWSALSTAATTAPRRIATLSQRGRAAVAESRKLQIVSLVLLLLILLGAGVPLFIIYAPASVASVSITPVTKHPKNEYHITGLTTASDATQNPIHARHIGFTARTTKTTPASGKGHQDAVAAKGTFVFTNPTDNIVTGTDPGGTTWTFTGTIGGINFTSDATQYIQINAQTTGSLPMHADPGANGNVGAHFVDGYYQIHEQKIDPVTNIATDTGKIYYSTITNPDGFSGGQDAFDYAYVQQLDIDSLATPLTTQLTSDAMQVVNKQVKPGEKIAGVTGLADGINCSPTVQGSQANDRVATATVTVSVTCDAMVYDTQAADATAKNMLDTDMLSQLGAHYQRLGDMHTTVTFESHSTDSVFLTMQAEGLWVYQFDKARLQQLTLGISGKPQSDALTFLRTQQGVAKATISTSGFGGTALPWAAENIHILVLPVSPLSTG